VEENLHTFQTLTLCGSELWASDFLRIASVMAGVRVSSALGEPLVRVLFWGRCDVTPTVTCIYPFIAQFFFSPFWLFLFFHCT
jgi:hypothetical protein